MIKYLHRFNSQTEKTEFETLENGRTITSGDTYHEPYVGIVVDENKPEFNKEWSIKFRFDDGRVMKNYAIESALTPSMCSEVYNESTPAVHAEFGSCFKTTTRLSYPPYFLDAKFNKGLITLANQTFYANLKSTLTGLTIPNTVENINNLFSYHQAGRIKDIYVPASVSSLTYEAFSTSVYTESIKVDHQNPYYTDMGGCNIVVNKSNMQLLISCKNSVFPEGIVSIVGETFGKNYAPNVITFPSTLTSIGSAFSTLTSYLANITAIKFLSQTPPSIVEANSVVFGLDNVVGLYVPDEAVNTYKQTSPYSQYADKIFPLSEYVETA